MLDFEQPHRARGGVCPFTDIPANFHVLASPDCVLTQLFLPLLTS
jgi:hypothetical protein